VAIPNHSPAVGCRERSRSADRIRMLWRTEDLLRRSGLHHLAPSDRTRCDSEARESMCGYKKLYSALSGNSRIRNCVIDVEALGRFHRNDQRAVRMAWNQNVGQAHSAVGVLLDYVRLRLASSRAHAPRQEPARLIAFPCLPRIGVPILARIERRDWALRNQRIRRPRSRATGVPEAPAVAS